MPSKHCLSRNCNIKIPSYGFYPQKNIQYRIGIYLDPLFFQNYVGIPTHLKIGVLLHYTSVIWFCLYLCFYICGKSVQNPRRITHRQMTKIKMHNNFRFFVNSQSLERNNNSNQEFVSSEPQKSLCTLYLFYSVNYRRFEKLTGNLLFIQKINIFSYIQCLQ